MDSTPPSSTEGSLKALKIIFFTMMLILIGGAIFLFVSIYKHNQSNTTSAHCIEGNIELPVQNEIVSVSRQGNIVTLLTKERRRMQEIILFDYCVGEVLKRVEISRDKKN